MQHSFEKTDFSSPSNPNIVDPGAEIRFIEGGCALTVAGVGTGGTLQGAGTYLKERNPNVMLVAVEPDESPVLSGGKPGFHQVR